MRIFDFTHAYQPFQPPEFIPSLIKENLTRIFLPLSRAMRKGVVKRGLQLQGWTISAWLSAGDPIRGLAAEVLSNLKEAAQKKNIEIGVSAYSHPIVPLLSDKVMQRQVEEDLAVVREYLGEPTWFWFPEAAVDGRSLPLLHQLLPNLTAVIPDGSLGKNRFSGFVRIKFEDGSFQRAAVGNTLLKDIFMNAEDYKEKPEYLPRKFNWQSAIQAAYSGEAFRTLLGGIYPEPIGEAILMRDLENAGSRYGLVELEKGVKEVRGLVESNLAFSFPSEVDWEKTPSVSIGDIKASCWEPAASEDNPYPYWVPVSPPEALRPIVSTWKQLVEVFNKAYRPDFPKESLLVLASDTPWHFLGRKEWECRPRHSTEFTKKVILPTVEEIGNSDLSGAADELLKAISISSQRQVVTTL